MIPLGVLVSGRGSNLEAVLRAVDAGALPQIKPVLVISNRPGVRALDVARRHGVPARVLRRADFGGDAAARDRAIGEALADASVQLVLLAGYDQLLRPPFFEAYRGRTINIHPSLLPRHGGAGMMGEAVHRSVLEAGDERTGATVHEVTPDLDAGPVIAQTTVPVEPADDVEGLAARVLAEEHRLLVATLRRLGERTSDGTSSARMAAASEAPTGADHPQETPHA
jgi:phosphoribosylglycinamide formyltransferase-1